MYIYIHIYIYTYIYIDITIKWCLIRFQELGAPHRQTSHRKKLADGCHSIWTGGWWIRLSADHTSNCRIFLNKDVFFIPNTSSIHIYIYTDQTLYLLARSWWIFIPLESA